MGAAIRAGIAYFAVVFATGFALGGVAFGRGVAEQLAACREVPGALGLAAQLAFGLFPTLRRAGRHRR